MRAETPSRRWYLRWVKAHERYGGSCDSYTLRTFWPRAVELYQLGATPAAAGNATATESNFDW
jgi:hypothetical protein